jgi:hypothetical protein
MFSESFSESALAKIALGDLVAALSDARVVTLASHASSIGSASLLYALIDPKRKNRPTPVQLREAVGTVRSMVQSLTVAADNAERTARYLERHAQVPSVGRSSHQPATEIRVPSVGRSSHQPATEIRAPR